ncbi:MAG: HAMP domain-containing histidine kinase, partial [Anaerolineales bacterium]|nr:HAMP domain-containing histidine kinase [Anaerolineales bacterium]
MRSLSIKLILAFLLVSLAGTALGALFAAVTTARQFNEFVLDQAQMGLVENLTAYYETNGSWQGVDEAFRFSRLWRDRENGRMQMPVLLDMNGRVLIGHMGGPSGMRLSAADLERGIPIEVGGEVVGVLLPSPQMPRDELVAAETAFLRRVNQTLFVGSLGGTLLGVLLGIVLARTLTRPIRELTTATRAVAQGDLAQQVPVRSADELGALARAFNQMSADLAQASQLRRQMTADIAHDLRTPLSVILGYTEALNDGKLAGDPELYGVLHREAQHLSHLVDDLRTLSLADAGELPLQRQPEDPRELLARTAAAYASQAQARELALEATAPADLPAINVDAERMAQVLGNLVSNALRYTPAGGRITLEARPAPGGAGVQLLVSDTGAGIAPQALPHIFERFYRGDEARAQQGEESGLGLAIAKSIVEAHGGTIAARSELGLGTTFVLTFAGS